MPSIACPYCRARYRVRDENLGKRAACAKCGKAFALTPADDKVLPLEPLRPPQVGSLAPTAGAIGSAGSHAPQPAAGPRHVGERVGAGPGQLSQLGAYVADLAGAWRTLAQPGSLVTLGGLCFLLIVQHLVQVAPGIGTFGALIIRGWFLAFLLNVVVAAAAGDDDLPGVTLTDGFVDGIFAPLAKFLCVSFLSVLPLAAACAYCMITRRLPAFDAVMIAFAVLLFDFAAIPALLTPHPGTNAILLSAALAGQVMQPMLLLVVAVGGFGGLPRIDLMLVTMVNTALGYLAMLMWWVLCGGLVFLVQVFAFADDPSAWTTMSWFVAKPALTTVLSVMQMLGVGLYYHHFKSGFAWSWG
jgi:predicted Zn finger-like uncharacterized protein